ncbi:uncharacterized protein KY384_005887 [Bacidia gigantensis]|uniref:uncharacterized protein n=1 Tax=Bacidia gigantensis TaxID=2732470 RepID=UPI001D03832D|nr:uncharacterized protein KY384_005887 [Bacidia gigantensis]KAG8529252.1 hypothetical protein KY384_005887 [Bacidia gigantensis]
MDGPNFVNISGGEQKIGPTTILLQTRAARLNDVLTSREVNEIAEAQPGIVQSLVDLQRLANVADPSKAANTQTTSAATVKAPRMRTASIDPDGRVIFEASEGLKNVN